MIRVIKEMTCTFFTVCINIIFLFRCNNVVVTVTCLCEYDTIYVAVECCIICIMCVEMVVKVSDVNCNCS